MDEQQYIEQKMDESYTVNGEGIDRELYNRIYLDGVKTGIAYIMLLADPLIQEKSNE